RDRLASLLDALGHLLVDPRLQGAQRLAGPRVARGDRERDLPLLGRAAQLAVALERLRLLAVARGERIARGRGGPCGLGPLGGTGPPCAAAQQEREPRRGEPPAAGPPH